MAELGIRDLGGYRAHLEATKDEWAVLGQFCRIPISRFHRDRAVFACLRSEILPERAEAARRAGRPNVRIWSAGCASGEEPYTIAILWNLEIATTHPGVGLELLATDIDATMIARAERGCYGGGSLRELPTTLREAAFDHDGDFCVRDAIRKGLTFRRQDMREIMPNGPLDIVLCRNSAFTYFDEPTQCAVGARIVERLGEGGLLVVGTHEAPRVSLEGVSLRAPCIFERGPS
jgi:chemotaxis protein methyltransferase CheR